MTIFKIRIFVCILHTYKYSSKVSTITSERLIKVVFKNIFTQLIVVPWVLLTDSEVMQNVFLHNITLKKAHDRAFLFHIHNFHEVIIQFFELVHSSHMDLQDIKRFSCKNVTIF